MTARDLRRLYQVAWGVHTGSHEPFDYAKVERDILNNIYALIHYDEYLLDLPQTPDQEQHHEMKGEYNHENIMQAYILASNVYLLYRKRYALLTRYKKEFWDKHKGQIYRYAKSPTYPTIVSTHHMVYQIPYENAIRYTFEFGDLVPDKNIIFKNPYHAVHVARFVETEFVRWIQDKLHTLN